jgi:hypothetical protein
MVVTLAPRPIARADKEPVSGSRLANCLGLGRWLSAHANLGGGDNRLRSNFCIIIVVVIVEAFVIIVIVVIVEVIVIKIFVIVEAIRCHGVCTNPVGGSAFASRTPAFAAAFDKGATPLFANWGPSLAARNVGLSNPTRTAVDTHFEPAALALEYGHLCASADSSHSSSLFAGRRHDGRTPRCLHIVSLSDVCVTGQPERVCERGGQKKGGRES